MRRDWAAAVLIILHLLPAGRAEAASLLAYLVPCTEKNPGNKEAGQHYPNGAPQAKTFFRPC